MRTGRPAPLLRMSAEKDEKGHTIVTERMIQKAFEFWQRESVRYQTLYDFYIGNHPRPPENRDGADIVVNYCKYTTDSIVGYIAGKPTAYHPNTAEAEEVVGILDRDNVPEKDKDTLTKMSIFGRAYRLVYLSKDGTPKTTVLDPRQANVVYTGTVEPESIFGYTIYSQTDEAGKLTFYITTYTSTESQDWESSSALSPYGWHKVGEPKPHRFGRVPLVEYKNAESYLGDFESILSLQEAYNRLMSDRQDDKDSFANAMLILQGNILGATPDELEEGKDFLKKHKILQMDEGSVAQWLTKTLQEADTQVYADALTKAMHKLAHVPDLSDESFSANASGVAMAYKLYGTDLLAGDKEILFVKAQRYLFKLVYAGVHNAYGDPDFAVPETAMDIETRFTHSVPNDLSYEANALSMLVSSGIVSKETAMAHCSIVTDVEEEKKRISEEFQQTLADQKSQYADEFAVSYGAEKE